MAEPTASNKMPLCPALLLGIVGVCLVIIASFLPLVERPGAPPLSLFTGGIDPGLAVIVLAVLSIVLCLVQRYGWLLITGPLAAVAALMAVGEQIQALAGRDVDLVDLFDVYNGILPAGMTSTRMVEVSTLLGVMAPGIGAWLLIAGLVLTVVTPALRRAPVSRTSAEVAIEGVAAAPCGRAIEDAATAPTGICQDNTNAMLIDNLYIFANDMNRELSFGRHAAAGGGETTHKVILVAAGYRDQTYFLRCRDGKTGETRDFAAHRLRNVVDQSSGKAIPTDELLEDLARAAHEAYGASNR